VMTSRLLVVSGGIAGFGLLIIEGQQHIAIDLVPEVFADHVVAFLRDQR
jgi:hypothetical protein